MGLLNMLCIFVLVSALSIINIDAFLQSELDAFSNLAKDFIKDIFIGKKLGDINDKSVYLRDITITDVTFPKISVTESNATLILSLSGAGVSLEGQYKVNVLIFKESGSLTASASDVSLSLPISLRLSSFLSVDKSQCRDSIGQITYDAKGGILGEAANILKGFVEDPLKKALNGEICEAVTNAIKNNVDKLRSAFDTIIG